jgi:L,D-transpeptidase ErfK/SrfK
MVSPSAINRSVMVLCYAGAALLAAGAWQDYVNPNAARHTMSFRPSRLAYSTTALSHAPEIFSTANIKVIINLSQRQLKLMQNDTILESFPSSRRQRRLADATWGSLRCEICGLIRSGDIPLPKKPVGPGPDNPLGSRWIGFLNDGEYHIGIHGTNQETLIGEAVSHGCVRMFDKDIQTLYSYIRIGTPIIVEP